MKAWCTHHDFILLVAHSSNSWPQNGIQGTLIIAITKFESLLLSWYYCYVVMSYHYLFLFCFFHWHKVWCLSICVHFGNAQKFSWFGVVGEGPYFNGSYWQNVCGWTFVSVPHKNVIVLHHMLPSLDPCVAELLLRVGLMRTLWIQEYLMRVESTYEPCA